MQIQNQVCLTVKIVFFFLDKLSIKVMLFQIKKKKPLCSSGSLKWGNGILFGSLKWVKKTDIFKRFCLAPAAAHFAA